MPSHPRQKNQPLSEPPGVLRQADIDEFKRLVKETTGDEMTNQEAWDRAIALFSLYRMMLRPIPEDPERNNLPKEGSSE